LSISIEEIRLQILEQTMNDMAALGAYASELTGCIAAVMKEEIQVRSFLDLLDIATASATSRIFVAGNGGSAAVASHFVVDCHKLTFGQAVCLSDNAPLLTAMANDNREAWAGAYKHALASYSPRPHDLLIAISSSGKSDNIVSLVEYAIDKDMRVATLTGFKPRNPVELATGELNWGVARVHAPSENYGVVEDCHQVILHWACQQVSQRMT
jgi:D-sedoheptulose 7-phosphate isomerase